MVKKIVINVNKQLDGYTFSLSPIIRSEIKKIFPNSNPIKSIFISSDTKEDFSKLFGEQVEQLIFHTLVGVDEKKLREIKQISFVDAMTQKTYYSLKN